MIETKIEQLTSAIERLIDRIDALTHALPVQDMPQGSVNALRDAIKPEPIKTPYPTATAPQTANREAISAASVKALAKEKMTAGVIDRAEVKVMIEGLGADSITDLNAEQLFELTTLLEER